MSRKDKVSKKTRNKGFGQFLFNLFSQMKKNETSRKSKNTGECTATTACDSIGEFTNERKRSRHACLLRFVA